MGHRTVTSVMNDILLYFLIQMLYLMLKYFCFCIENAFHWHCCARSGPLTCGLVAARLPLGGAKSGTKLVKEYLFRT